MVIATLARKDLRLLMRDPRAMIILLAMPLIFIAVLGISLGEGFGQKAADRLKVSIVIEDEGPPRHFDSPAILREGFGVVGSAATAPLTAATFAQVNGNRWFPHDKWSDRVIADLRESADISIEILTREEAEALVHSGKRAAVVILGKNFSKRVARCSFLSPGWKEGLTLAATYPHFGDPVALMGRGLFDENQKALPLYLFDGLNPFHREGVNVAMLDVELLRDPTQQTAAAIIDQVAQGSLLRVVMPWMIGRAFEKVSDPQFLALLGGDPNLPTMVKGFFNPSNPFVSEQDRKNLSMSLKNSLQRLFPRYDLTAKTWAGLTKSQEGNSSGADLVSYKEDGVGFLRRGGIRYQVLVPSSLVMFAFFLVLTVGWLIVAERRQGTLKRLVVPISRIEILVGKLLPCLLLSWFQGFAILLAGKIVFGMNWGPQPVWLIGLVGATSFAAMGLALWVAALARNETQVAIYGTVIVIVLALLSGCIGDRSLMPETMQQISRVTPHAWALDGYRQLLTNPEPRLRMVAEACGVLMAFGCGFLTLAWVSLRWE